MSTKIVYPCLEALCDAFGDNPNKFALGGIEEVRIQGTRKKAKYRLEEMSEMQSSMKSLHWVYVHPEPRQRNAIDWVGYRNQATLHSR
jgi:hypothetical protein